MRRTSRQRRAGVVSSEFLVLLPVFLFVMVALVSMNDLFSIDSTAMMNARLRAWHSSGSNNSLADPEVAKVHRFQQANAFSRSFMGVLLIDGTVFARAAGSSYGVLAGVPRAYRDTDEAPEEFSAPWDYPAIMTTRLYEKQRGINRPVVIHNVVYAYNRAFRAPTAAPPATGNFVPGNRGHELHALHAIRRQTLANALPQTGRFSEASYPNYARFLAQNAVGIQLDNPAIPAFLDVAAMPAGEDRRAWKYRRFGQSQATLYSRLVGMTGMLQRYALNAGNDGTGLGVGEMERTGTRAVAIDSYNNDLSPLPDYVLNMRYQRAFSSQQVLLGGERH